MFLGGSKGNAGKKRVNQIHFAWLSERSKIKTTLNWSEIWLVKADRLEKLFYILLCFIPPDLVHGCLLLDPFLLFQWSSFFHFPSYFWISTLNENFPTANTNCKIIFLNFSYKQFVIFVDIFLTYFRCIRTILRAYIQYILLNCILSYETIVKAWKISWISFLL